MSLSKTAKCEIVKKNIFEKEAFFLAQGFVMTAGSLVISNGELSFSLVSECEEVINFFDKILKSIDSDTESEEISTISNFKNKERFTLNITRCGNKLLEKFGFVVRGTNGEIAASQVGDKSYMKRNESMKAFLTGAFLGSGSVSVPSDEPNKKSYGYHFEISLSSKEQADLIAEIMSNFDIFPKIVSRGEQYIVYLKNCDFICDALGLFGASKVVLDTLNKRVSRDIMSQTNRQINCISHNIDKTVSAALKQLQSIELIRSTIGIENLPEPLAEVALARLANPEASLKDLTLAIGSKITKGAIAQRFEKINKIADELGENNEN